MLEAAPVNMLVVLMLDALGNLRYNILRQHDSYNLTPAQHQMNTFYDDCIGITRCCERNAMAQHIDSITASIYCKLVGTTSVNMNEPDLAMINAHLT